VSDTDKLEALLAELPTHRAPAGWRDRVFAALDAGTPSREIRPQPTRRVWWLAGGGLLAAGACLLLYLRIPSSKEARGAVAIEVKRTAPDAERYRQTDPVRPGDTIVIRAHAAEALRVYRNRMQIARCPGHAGCTRNNDELTLALPVTAHGTVVAIIYRPALPEPEPGWEPSAADQDADLALAARLQITMKMSEPIEMVKEP
jgi:hypothetical protein